jgi:hypothetical protein
MNMKKYLLAAAVLGILVAGALLIKHAVNAPSLAAARDLIAINSLTVSQTTEADLLRRTAFQKATLECSGGLCSYSTDRENSLLSLFHLAPRTTLSTTVLVQDGIVVQIFAVISSKGTPSVAVVQGSRLPNGCAADPCVKLPHQSDKFSSNIIIQFTNQSELHNRWPQILNVECLSRLRGCNSYAALMPVAKELNLPSSDH